MPINPTPIAEKSAVGNETKIRKKIVFREEEPRFTLSDIILQESVKVEVERFLNLEKNRELVYEKWGMRAVFKKPRNYSISLYGESGTGKTMLANALAAELKKKIILVDYSEIESKYVGETSKNLVALFEQAAKTDAVIVFDEADALLSKRVTTMTNATDVSVNQTRNVLLQLLDSYTGVVIFTTNFIQNYDSAFFRRITTHIKFEVPDLGTREKLWSHYIVDGLPMESKKEIIVEDICKIEGLTGADISNIVLETAFEMAQKSIKLSAKLLKKNADKYLKNKEGFGKEHFIISTRKVSQEYALQQLNKEGDKSWD